ncbi:hypothetical protein RND81_14G035900 [Saponaria officinalis]|uniref:Kinesin-like protein n=1 Tax=Saponaria officinalis TaxID=3572 RepID=A0AAW1GIY0_SAPOF
MERYEAVKWLESVVGPLGLPSEPTEADFVSCLRNGIILCNVINKIQPGIISKVVQNNVPVESESNLWDSRPLPAYMYFVNVRNFLVAVEELKLPAFEASDLQRENLQAGSAARIVDCILALKSYHEWKESSGGHGVYKHATVKSTPFVRSASVNFSRTSNTHTENKQTVTDSFVKTLSGNMADSKENLSDKFLSSLQNGNQQDPVHIFSEILLSFLEEKQKNRISQLNVQQSSETVDSESHSQSTSILTENSSFKSNSECATTQERKHKSDHWRILHNQETGLKDIKALWSETKSEFEDLQKQLMNDLKHLGSLVEEMSDRARGYQKVIQENRKLYNMVQDLKGNVRVCCRIRPMLNSEAKNIVGFQGGDDKLVVLDPITLGAEEYQFTHVYGPMATQDELFKVAQPLIRSVMDGHNVCIFAYGQTRSGKSYTMYGPSGVSDSEKKIGINFFALNDLFETINVRKYTITYQLQVQMVEICNEQIRDLLAEDSTQQVESNLSNVTSHSIKTNDEAINLVKQGAVRRTADESSETTALSNTSHSVLTIHVQGKDLSEKILRSRLHLVDLAGSGGDDKSISCLEEVITSLSQKKSYTRYKDSKLTSLLEDALGGKAKILVFAHVIPEGDGFTNTISTLKFAQRISPVDHGAARTNKPSNEVMELRNEIESLKSELGDQVACSSQRNPVKSRRLSLENQGKSNKAPPLTSLRVRRLSLETPKNNTLTESPTADIAKNGNSKGSQLKRSLQAMGKFVTGSDKNRNQQKQESASTKSKDAAANGSKEKISRRHSLTSLPPSGTSRRSSLGGVSTDSAKRWM